MTDMSIDSGSGNVAGQITSMDGVDCYRIDGVEQMAPFLMSVVSSADLWMFVSSTGGLTAGRVDADHAIFPYQTDDRLHQAAGIVGSVTVIARTIEGRRRLWRPFSSDRHPACSRAVAKSILGDRLIVEECHREWGITFRSTWAPSPRFGWVRTVELSTDRTDVAEFEVLDGLVDVMPAGVEAELEQTRSNLVDAYKRSESGRWGRLAVYTLEALISDRAEPAESLGATTVWSSGFPGATVHLDRGAVSAMIDGRSVGPQTLLTGRPGAYLLRGTMVVSAGAPVRWTMVADTGLDHADVAAAVHLADDPDATILVTADIEAGSTRLRTLLAAADGFQSTADGVADAHHLSNVLFNSMRGGVFPYGHRVPMADFASFVDHRNRDVGQRWAEWIGSHGRWLDVTDLRRGAGERDDPDLVRLVLEYLPLTFSRRHGDPSRPWNRFSIDVEDLDGNELLSYEGNWRDIFQNWEAMLRSFPAYFPHVVAKFVNASTIDGHNPYRISDEGIDWEIPDPSDLWSHIGYWGDHQIIYLLRLLEAWECHEPGAIAGWLNRPVFVHANVPYCIADHDDMVRDPRNTIAYDRRLADEIAARERRLGTDGRLLAGAGGDLVRVGLGEKLLVPALAKLSSFVPGGGLWLNTQRPEWNDANNALAGPGLSVVTLLHLHRYLRFVDSLLARSGATTVLLSSSVARWFEQVAAVFDRYTPTDPIDDRGRRAMLDALGVAAAEHRKRIASREDQLSVEVATDIVRHLFAAAGECLDHTIREARRSDGLFHSYNRVSFPDGDRAQVDHLGLMLEGQVAALSSGVLDPEDALGLIDALFESDMYRPDQDSFMLYPEVRLPAFLDRNVVPADRLGVMDHDDATLQRLFVTDSEGRGRFRSHIINAAALDESLEGLGLSDSQRAELHELYEAVFDHRSFTGRSSSMYGYEGIGSIYWHMIAKLLLAVQETYWSAIDGGASADVIDRLARAYGRIQSGLGYRKSPDDYGAIPTDCYSHTPAHAGAQQPGMTGQVKEEVLTRFGELGVRVFDGILSLWPGLLDLAGVVTEQHPTDGSSCASFTYCAVPMTIERGPGDGVRVVGPDGVEHQRDALTLTFEESQMLFARSGVIAHVAWMIGPRA